MFFQISYLASLNSTFTIEPASSAPEKIDLRKRWKSVHIPHFPVQRPQSEQRAKGVMRPLRATSSAVRKPGIPIITNADPTKLRKTIANQVVSSLKLPLLFFINNFSLEKKLYCLDS